MTIVQACGVALHMDLSYCRVLSGHLKHNLPLWAWQQHHQSTSRQTSTWYPHLSRLFECGEHFSFLLLKARQTKPIMPCVRALYTYGPTQRTCEHSTWMLQSDWMVNILHQNKFRRRITTQPAIFFVRRLSSTQLYNYHRCWFVCCIT